MCKSSLAQCNFLASSPNVKVRTRTNTLTLLCFICCHVCSVFITVSIQLVSILTGKFMRRSLEDVIMEDVVWVQWFQSGGKKKGSMRKQEELKSESHQHYQASNNEIHTHTDIMRHMYITLLLHKIYSQSMNERVKTPDFLFNTKKTKKPK